MEWWQILLIILGSLIVLFVLSIIFYKQFFKRFWDIVLSGLAIIVLSPLLIVLTIVGAITMKGNPFFTQKRPGKNEKIFKLIKFRSMSFKHDEYGKLLPDKERINSYGAFLRKTSIDELPELFNIFIGNMSVVGPRPLLIEYLPWYTNEEKHRHDIKPGLTGYAQINGRNYLDWDKRFECDIYYVCNYSLFLDIKIILKTILKVFKKENIQVNTDELEGNMAEIRKDQSRGVHNA